MYQLSVDFFINGVFVRDEDGEVISRCFANNITCEEIAKEIIADAEKLGSGQAVEARIQGYLDGETVEFAKDEILVNRGQEVVEEAVRYVFNKINEWVEDYNYPDGSEDLEIHVRAGTKIENERLICRNAGGLSFSLPLSQAKVEMWPTHEFFNSGISEDRQSRVFAILLRLIEEFESENAELEAA